MSENEDAIAGCLADGATSTQYNTSLLEFAKANGATAIDLNGAMMQVFGTLGYTGTYNERYQQWKAAGYPGVP